MELEWTRYTGLLPYVTLFHINEQQVTKTTLEPVYRAQAKKDQGLRYIIDACWRIFGFYLMHLVQK